MKVYFSRGEIDCNKTSNEYIYVNNCGGYVDANRVMKIERESRVDYQMIYVDSGKCIVHDNNKVFNLSDGHIILYRPGQPQKYTFELGTTYFWIHFSGVGVDYILETLEINKFIYKVGNFVEFIHYVKKIINECSLIDKNEVLIVAYFLELLCILSKNIKNAKRTRFSAVVNLMLNDGFKNYTNKYYANLCNMSEGHFINSFKKEYGVAPHTYVNNIQIQKAKSMLVNTSIKVEKIANLLNFDDPLYFSRLFKRKTGFSPTEFRKNELDNTFL